MRRTKSFKSKRGLDSNIEIGSFLSFTSTEYVVSVITATRTSLALSKPNLRGR